MYTYVEHFLPFLKFSCVYFKCNIQRYCSISSLVRLFICYVSQVQKYIHRRSRLLMCFTLILQTLGVFGQRLKSLSVKKIYNNSKYKKKYKSDSRKMRKCELQRCREFESYFTFQQKYNIYIHTFLLLSLKQNTRQTLNGLREALSNIYFQPLRQ